MSRKSSQGLSSHKKQQFRWAPAECLEWAPGWAGNIKNRWRTWFGWCLVSNGLATLSMALRACCILIRDRIGNELIIPAWLFQRENEQLCAGGGGQAWLGTELGADGAKPCSSGNLCLVGSERNRKLQKLPNFWGSGESVLWGAVTTQLLKAVI